MIGEPFEALGPLTPAELLEHFLRIHDKLGLAAILVIHDITQASLPADRSGTRATGNERPALEEFHIGLSFSLCHGLGTVVLPSSRIEARRT